MITARTMVIGGARSGKSSFAEKLVTSSPKRWVYVATAQAFDAEMEARVSQHRESRGEGWQTIEEPMDLAGVLRRQSADDAVLVDCATLWLSNQLLAGGDVAAQADALLEALRRCAADVVVVTNEVGQGIVPENALGRQFRDAQGRLNQQLAAWADLAVLVTAGLPLALKGQLP